MLQFLWGLRRVGHDLAIEQRKQQVVPGTIPSFHETCFILPSQCFGEMGSISSILQMRKLRQRGRMKSPGHTAEVGPCILTDFNQDMSGAGVRGLTLSALALWGLLSGSTARAGLAPLPFCPSAISPATVYPLASLPLLGTPDMDRTPPSHGFGAGLV